MGQHFAERQQKSSLDLDIFCLRPLYRLADTKCSLGDKLKITITLSDLFLILFVRCDRALRTSSKLLCLSGVRKS